MGLQDGDPGADENDPDAVAVSPYAPPSFSNSRIRRLRSLTWAAVGMLLAVAALCPA